MRYRGQGHEIAVPLPPRPYRDGDAAVFHAAFEEAYRRLYSRIIPGVEVEVLSWVMLLSGPALVEARRRLPSPRALYAAARAPSPGLRPRDRRVHRRGNPRAPQLLPGAVIPGPAIIVEDETSTVVSRLFDARIDAFGYIELSRHGG